MTAACILHDRDDAYNWYDTNPETNGGFEGYANDDGAICSGYDAAQETTWCNTQAFVARVNAAGWCGAKDWRLPTLDELRGIVDYCRTNPAIDTNYFPDTQSDWYWSASPYASSSGWAWYVGFGYGSDGYDGKYYDNHVRLVRGGQALPSDPGCATGISPSQRELPAAGAIDSVTVAAPAGCNWLAVSQAPWLQVTAGQSGQGPGEVSYQAEANTLPNGRIGTLTIGGHTFSVSQAGSTAVTGLARLSGTIRDASGHFIGGASVQLGAVQTSSQAGTGAYSFTGVTPSTYTLTVSKSGYAPWSQPLTLAPKSAVVRDVTLRASGGTPSVKDITTPYDPRFYFLEGVSHPVDFFTQVNWAGQTPNAVRLTTDKHVYEVPASSSHVARTLNAGDEFTACGGLKAQALWSGGQSTARDANFGVMWNPLFFVPWWSRTEGGGGTYSAISRPWGWTGISSIAKRMMIVRKRFQPRFLYLAVRLSI